MKRAKLGAVLLVTAAALRAAAQDQGDLKPVEPGRAGAAPPGTSTAAVGSPARGKRDPFELDALTVLGTLPRNAAGSDVVRARDFELRPIRTPGDLLRIVPGLHTSQHQGGGKADQIFLRGFDCDHGTDVGVFVEGMPVNLRSHAHGQGWSDTHFVIPEMVKTVEVRKGTYFADLGDFSVAGAVRYQLRDELPDDQRIYAQASYGSWDTRRVVLAATPYRTDDVKTIVAGELYYTDGPTKAEQNYLRGNLFAKASARVAKDVELSGWLTWMDQSWDGSGQVPRRAVAAGIIDRFGSIDDSEGGHAGRQNLHVQATWTPDKQDLLQARLYGSREWLRLWSNFTFFENDPVLGDQLVQIDDRWLGGGDARWEHVEKLGPVMTKTTLGIETRTDVARVQLGHSARRIELGITNHVDIVETSVSPWLECEVAPTRGVRVIGGARGDAFWFTVRDKRDASVPIDGSRSDALPQGKGGLVLGPFKATDPEASTELYLNVGSGFHSNDARAAVLDRKLTTLAQALEWEVGFRSYAFDRLDVAASFFVIDVQNELVFSGDEGVPEPSGRTRRIGGELELRLRAIDDWLWLEADVTYTEGRFTKDNAPIPLAPRLLVRGGVRVKTPVGFEASFELRHLGRRPLDDAGLVDAPEQSVFDIVLRWIPPFCPNLELFARIENAFDVKWREAQFFNTSRLPSEAAPVPDVHFTPGAPITAVGGVIFRW